MMGSQALSAALSFLLVITLPAGRVGSRRQLSVRRLASSPVAFPPRATQYFGHIRIGKPAKEFRVVFDTSSGHLVLPGADCDDDACSSHRRFGNSTTAVQIGWTDDPTKPIADSDDRDMKNLNLLGSDVTGVFVRDNICVGDEDHASCGLADFVTLTEESDEPFGEIGFDGVLGLAPSTSDGNEFNVLNKLLGKKHRTFAVYLSPVFGSGHDGEISFGGYRPERMAAEQLTWVPVSSNGTWQIMVDDITVGGKSLGLCGAYGCSAAIDTGASLIEMPSNMLWQLTKKLDVDDQCTKTPPSIGFSIKGQKFELHAEDYVEHGSDGCALSLASNGGAGKGPALILGYPFLRRFYTVFDLEQNRVGLALAKHANVASSKKDGMSTVKLVGLRP